MLAKIFCWCSHLDDSRFIDELMSKNVSFVRIVRDPKTDNSKGFAFVAFKENAAIPLALQLDGSIFKSRPLRVKRVQKKSKTRSHQHSLRNIAKQRTGHMLRT
ncbi:RNA recognition motif family protein [Brugia pahangi]